MCRRIGYLDRELGVLDVLGASASPFDEKVHRTRPYPGQTAVAANLTRLLAGERQLGQMPPRGRELYELQYGAQARQLLYDVPWPATRSPWARCRGGSFTHRPGMKPRCSLGSTTSVKPAHWQRR